MERFLDGGHDPMVERYLLTENLQTDPLKMSKTRVKSNLINDVLRLNDFDVVKIILKDKALPDVWCERRAIRLIKIVNVISLELVAEKWHYIDC